MPKAAASVNLPEISVLMPVYNAGEFIAEAVQSILNQTYTNFELLIINDGSTDNTIAILSGFDDNRIRVTDLIENKGLVQALNTGLKVARGAFIARMDADDIAHPERLERQVKFMAENPAISISGTWFEILNNNKIISHPLKHEECMVALLENTVLGHPTVIMRRDDIVGMQYTERVVHAEDYQFWCDAVNAGLKLANIQNILLYYRSHKNQVSSRFVDEQLFHVNEIRVSYAAHNFKTLTAANINIYQALINNNIHSHQSFNEAKKIVRLLLAENEITNKFDRDILGMLLGKWLKQAAFRIYVLCIDCSIRNLLKAVIARDFYRETTFFQKGKYLLTSIGLRTK